MKHIRILLQRNEVIKETIKTKKSNVRRNVDWEDAEQMAKYLKLNTIFILKLFKKFGKNKVLNTQSYLKDFDGKCKLEQALVYRLNNTP